MVSEISDLNSEGLQKSRVDKVPIKKAEKGDSQIIQNHSKILQELQQVDTCVNREEEIGFSEQRKGKKAHQVDKMTQSAKMKVPKKPVKTAEMKRAEKENDKVDEEQVLKRIAMIKQRKEAEKSAAKEAKLEKQSAEVAATLKLLEAEKRQKAQQCHDDSPDRIDGQMLLDWEDDHKEEKKTERKRIKPEDWSCHVGGTNYQDTIVARQKRRDIKSKYRNYGGDEVDEDEEMPELDVHALIQARKPEQSIEEAEDQEPPKPVYIVIDDSDSDNDVRQEYDSLSNANSSTILERQYSLQTCKGDNVNGYDHDLDQDTLDWIQGQEGQPMPTDGMIWREKDEYDRGQIETTPSLEETALDDADDYQQEYEQLCHNEVNIEDLAGLHYNSPNEKESISGPFMQEPDANEQRQEIQGLFCSAPYSSPQPTKSTLLSSSKRLLDIDDVVARNEPGYLDHLLNDFD